MEHFIIGIHFKQFMGNLGNTEQVISAPAVWIVGQIRDPSFSVQIPFGESHTWIHGFWMGEGCDLQRTNVHVYLPFTQYLKHFSSMEKQMSL